MKLTQIQVLGLILLLTLVAYSHSLTGNGFIWDDDNYLTNNPAVQAPNGLATIWTQPTVSPFYYPLTCTLLWAEHKVSDHSPIGYHAVNVLAQAANACLFYLLLRRLQFPAALGAACLFAVHPINVETAAWISQQKNLFSMLFGLLAVWHYLTFAQLGPPEAPPADTENSISPHRWRSYALAGLFFLLAILCKSVVVMLPAALLLLIFWKRRKISRQDLEPTLPFFLVGAAVGLFTAYCEQAHVIALGDTFQITGPERVLVAGHALWFYLGTLLWPAHLIFMYPQFQPQADNLWQWAAPAAAVAALALTWLLQPRLGRGLFVAAAMYAVILFPALGFLKVYPMQFSCVADHFAYHAELPIIAGLMWLLWTLAQKWKLSADIQTAALGLILAGLTLLSFNQTRVYDDSASLWADTIRQCKALGAEPTWIAYDNLGTVLKAQGQPQAALEMFQTAAQIGKRAMSANNIASAYIDLRQFTEARKILEPLLQRVPNFYTAYNNYGVALLETGEPAKALTYFDQAWKHLGGGPVAALAMGRAYTETKDYPRAESMLKLAAQALPNVVEPHYHLVRLYVAWGKLPEAAAEVQIVQQLCAAQGLEVPNFTAGSVASRPATAPGTLPTTSPAGAPSTSPNPAPAQ